MTKSIYRYEIPIDDKPHTIQITDFPTRVEAVLASADSYLEFWAEHDPSIPPMDVTYQVYGTGHPIPDNGIVIGTAQRVHGLVFHLVELGVDSILGDEDGS